MGCSFHDQRVVSIWWIPSHRLWTGCSDSSALVAGFLLTASGVLIRGALWNSLWSNLVNIGHIHVKAEGKLGSTNYLPPRIWASGAEVWRILCCVQQSCYPFLPVKISCFLQLPHLSLCLHGFYWRSYQTNTLDLLLAVYPLTWEAGEFIVNIFLAFSSQWLLAKSTFLIAK